MCSVCWDVYAHVRIHVYVCMHMCWGACMSVCLSVCMCAAQFTELCSQKDLLNHLETNPSAVGEHLGLHFYE